MKKSKKFHNAHTKRIFFKDDKINEMNENQKKWMKAKMQHIKKTHSLSRDTLIDRFKKLCAENRNTRRTIKRNRKLKENIPKLRRNYCQTRRRIWKQIFGYLILAHAKEN